MKNNYQKLAFLLAAIMILTSSCGKKKDVSSYADAGTVTETTMVTGKDENTEIQKKRSYDSSILEIVNQEMRYNYQAAYENWQSHLHGKSFSKCLNDKGIKLNSEEADRINKRAERAMDLFKHYCTSYDSEAFDECYEIGLELNDLFTSALNKSVCYELFIRPILPKSFQSQMAYNGDVPVFDWNGNIILEDQKEVCILGPEDDIIKLDCYYGSLGDRSIAISNWYAIIPSYFDRDYKVLNRDEDAFTCYVWDAYQATQISNMNYYTIIQDGADVYNVSTNKITVRQIDDSYYFVDSTDNKNIYGELDSDSIDVERNIAIIDAALKSGEGDIFEIKRAYQDLCDRQVVNSFYR